jgi:hypothetical protein
MVRFRSMKTASSFRLVHSVGRGVAFGCVRYRWNTRTGGLIVQFGIYSSLKTPSFVIRFWGD